MNGIIDIKQIPHAGRPAAGISVGFKKFRGVFDEMLVQVIDFVRFDDSTNPACVILAGAEFS